MRQRSKRPGCDLDRQQDETASASNWQRNPIFFATTRRETRRRSRKIHEAKMKNPLKIANRTESSSNEESLGTLLELDFLAICFRKGYIKTKNVSRKFYLNSTLNHSGSFSSNYGSNVIEIILYSVVEHEEVELVELKDLPLVLR